MKRSIESIGYKHKKTDRVPKRSIAKIYWIVLKIVLVTLNVISYIRKDLQRVYVISKI
jgi:sensor histidine kinase regulating citrate/malate metabolism